MWPLLYPPKGKLKHENLNYRIIQLTALIEELHQQGFSGYLEVLAPHEKGLALFHQGTIYSCFYEGTEDLELSPEEIVQHFLSPQNRERDTVINVSELDPRTIEALGALEKRTPLHRELETAFLDLTQFFDTLMRKHFTGSLRFYRIRNNTRLGNILVKMKKITLDQLQEAIRLQLSEQNALRLGDALVRVGAIDAKDLESALGVQSNTRKGSDLELAISLFHDGYFLGGYTPTSDGLTYRVQEVLGWVNQAEVLMDIRDGGLPEPVDMRPQKASARPAAPAQGGKRPEAAPEKHPHKDKEGFTLKADDFVLDFSENALKPRPADGGMPAPPVVSPVRPPERPMPTPAADEPRGERSLNLGMITQAVKESMGSLGLALLDRECERLELLPGQISSQQARALVDQLEKTAGLLMGPTQAHQVCQQLRERIGH